MAAIADALTRVPVKASRGYWTGVVARLARDPTAMVALTIILVIVAAAILAPLIAPADPYKGSMIRRLRPIGFPGYPLGSDELGRDMLTRLIYGRPAFAFYRRGAGHLGVRDRIPRRHIRRLPGRPD